MKRKLLIVFAAGIAAAQSASAQWSLTGNAGIDTAVNFVGTTDSKALKFKTVGKDRMIILNNGKVGIGTVNPQSNLDVYVANTNVQFGVRSDSGNAVFFLDKKHTNDYNTVSYRTTGVAQWQTGSIGNDNFVIKNMTLLSPSITCLKTNNYVGIGTNVPSERLEVAGNIRSVGNIVATGTVSATGGNSTNWNTAYSWGNHATAGYLTAETDPQVGANTTNYIPKWNGSALITGSLYDASGYIGLGTTTPSFSLDVRASYSYIQAKATVGGAGVLIDKLNTTDNGYVIHRSGGLDRWTEGTIGNDNFSVHNWTTGYDAITANVSNNFVGINTNAPSYQLDVQGNAASSSTINLQSKVNYVGSVDVRGIYSYSVPADGYGYGADLTGGYYGASCNGNGGAYTGSAWGVAGYASGSAGTRYGVYGYAYNSGGAAWAGFFDGKTYAGSLVVGNSTAAASGYLLTVGGKIICTELKVQVQPFPDYVFDEHYKLNSIYDVENFISQNKRLPGMPTACEVEDNGMSVGEMQSKLVEKVEEQTLYIIQLQKQIDELKQLMTDLSKK